MIEECKKCRKAGACIDWIKAMADDSGVPFKWIRQEVKVGNIDADYGVLEVIALYELEGTENGTQMVI